MVKGSANRAPTCKEKLPKIVLAILVNLGR